MVTKPTGRPVGRPRKPAAIRSLHGGRYVEVPAPLPIAGIPTRPEAMSVPGAAYWDATAEPLVEAGVLTVADTGAYAEFCELTVLVRAARGLLMREMASKTVPVGPSASLGYSRVFTLYLVMLARFGGTPGDRLHLAAGGPVDPPMRGEDLLSGWVH